MPKKNRRGAGRPKDFEKMEKFAIWWALPKAKRDPKTIGEWIEQNEVAHSTTWRWRQDVEFRQKVLAYRLEVAEDSMTDVIQGLTNKATEGELGQAKFLMELLKDYIPRSEMQHTVIQSSGSNGFNEDMIEFIVEEVMEHPKMVEMSKDDLNEILSDILLEE